MGKKVQLVIWSLIAIVAILLIGVVGYNLVLNQTEEVIHPEVTFEIENYGNVKIELYPEYAPNTVTNFIKLVEKGYYNNKVVYGKDDICIYVGRDQEGNAINPTVGLIDDSIEAGTESDYDYTIPGEFVANGYQKNTLRHEKGVISLIRNDYTQYVQTLTEESYNSGNAQLGIMMSDNSSKLNGVYAAFGRVTEGMEILEKIYTEAEIKAPETAEDGSTNTSEGDIQAFSAYPVIKSATVDTHGIDYGMPKTEKAFDYSSYLYNLMSSYYSDTNQ